MNPRAFVREVAGVFCVVAVLYLTAEFWLPRFRDSRAKEQALHFRNSIALASTPLTVEQLARSPQYDRLELAKVSPELWIITTPYTWGAKNWYIYLTFADSSLVQVKVRTEDSTNEHPSDAPADLVQK